MNKISFVIPVYNSEKTIAQVVKEIIDTIESMELLDYEIILVDDGSKDAAFRVCLELESKIPKVRAYRLSKNFGQANALMAGLNQTTGDFVVCLDDDLQTPPKEFPKLYRELIDGDFDVVYGYYLKKQHSCFRNLGTKANSLMQDLVLNKPTNIHTSSYFIARRYIVDIVKNYDKPFPYLPGFFLEVSGSISCVPINHQARSEGKSGYSLKKLLDLWLNGFTNFSIKPLRFATLFGFLSAAVAFIMVIVLFILKLNDVDIQEGWTSTIIVILFIGGIQLLSVGILGEYVGRIYISVNKTPQYVVKNWPTRDHSNRLNETENRMAIDMTGEKKGGQKI